MVAEVEVVIRVGATWVVVAAVIWVALVVGMLAVATRVDLAVGTRVASVVIPFIKVVHSIKAARFTKVGRFIKGATSVLSRFTRGLCITVVSTVGFNQGRFTTTAVRGSRGITT